MLHTVLPVSDEMSRENTLNNKTVENVDRISEEVYSIFLVIRQIPLGYAKFTEYSSVLISFSKIK